MTKELRDETGVEYFCILLHHISKKKYVHEVPLGLGTLVSGHCISDTELEFSANYEDRKTIVITIDNLIEEISNLFDIINNELQKFNMDERALDEFMLYYGKVKGYSLKLKELSK